MVELIVGIKVGCDIVFLPRFERILGRTPEIKDRIFSLRELKGAGVKRLAGFFAAKEAAMKAIGLTAGGWRKIEILPDRTGRPRLLMEGVSARNDLSISHDGDYVLAFVIFYDF